jgi:hypothetical protein
MLQLFYDCLGVTNPLHGSSVTPCRFFFLSVKNQQHDSCFANVRLAYLLCVEHKILSRGAPDRLFYYPAGAGFGRIVKYDIRL